MLWKQLTLKKQNYTIISKRGRIICQPRKPSYFKKKIKEKNADDEEYCKIRDPCHCAGEYRGAVHNICNIKYGPPKEIPVIFHIGSNVTLYHKRDMRRI